MPMSDCEHRDVRYEQSTTPVRAVLFVLHKFVCPSCRAAARIVDRIDTD